MSAVLTPEVQLEQRAASLPEQARALQIVDRPSFELAADRLRGVVELRREIEAHHAPMKQKAFEAHRTICAAERKLLEPVAEAERILKSGIGAWELQQRRLREEEERLIREEAEREQAELIEAAAVEAEAQGATVEEVAAIIEQPIILPKIAASTETRVAGLSTAAVYGAEVVSLRDLCRAIADGKASPNFVAPNYTALNQAARAMRESFSVSGCRVVTTSSVRVAKR